MRTCCSDDCCTATQDAPCHFQWLPPSPWCHGKVEDIISHHITTEPHAKCNTISLPYWYVEYSMILSVLYENIISYQHVHGFIYHFYSHMSTLSLDHRHIDTHYNKTSLSFFTNPLCRERKILVFFSRYICTVMCASACSHFKSFSCWLAVGRSSRPHLQLPHWIYGVHTRCQSCSCGVLSRGSRQRATGSRRQPRLRRTGNP